MAYKRDDNGGQVAPSTAPSGGSSGGVGESSSLSSGGSKAAVKASSSGVGKSYSGGKTSAKASSSGQGKIYSGRSGGSSGSSGGSRGESTLSKSVSSGLRAKKGTKASFGTTTSPAWVGRNPYQWGNTTSIVNHWDDTNPERQAKLDSLGFAADDPDRTFHFYAPDAGSPKSYLEQADKLSSDRNYFQAGNFWNTINGQYASEEDRVSDAMEWMKDAQIYGNWAKEHGLTYTDENGEEKSMEEAWKEIWSYANDIAGGIGDSDSTRAGKEIQAYLTGGEYNSADTRRLMEQARQFSENAESEKDARYWADLEKSLNIQLKDDEKREKKENSFLGKAGDFFAAPEREQVDYTSEETADRARLQAEYDEAVRQRQEAEVNVTDPWDYTLFVQPLKDREDQLEAQLKDMNRAHGQKTYEGLEDAAQARDIFEGWYGGRIGNIAADAGAMLGGLGANFHGMGYVDETHRELTMQFQQAQAKALATLDPEDRAEADRLEAELQQYEEEHVEDNALERAGSTLINGAQDVVETAGAQTQEALEDMSDAGKMAVQIGMVGADVVLDMVENFAVPIPSKVIPGAGAVNMYARAGGANALDKLDAEGGNTNDYDRTAIASVVGKLSAFLSEKTFGSLESAYGGSFFGDLTDKLISKCSPFVQRGLKAVLNTEGGEEGFENFLNYLGDTMLDLNPNADLDTQRLQQDMAVGYGFGVIFNLLTHGVSISPNQMKSIAAESGEAGVAMAAGTPYSEIADIARETAKKDVTMKPQPEADTEGKAPPADLQAAARAGTSAAWDQETAASQSAALKGQDTSPAPAPTQTSEDIASTQAAALESQETAPQPAPAPAQATTASGPTANQTPYEGPQLPGGQYGGGGSVKIGKDRVPFHYAVIPASELIPSHGVDGTPNPNYPAELQPRDRTRETSQAQVRDIGAALNPEELEWSGTASTGAPVVRSDGVVISGNGRTSGIAYSQQIGRNAEYMQYIRDNAPRFGIDPATIQDGSVLVRVVDGEDHDWAKLAAGGNDSGVAKYSASESATADAKRLTSEGVSGILDLLNPEADGVTDSRNDAFVRAFIRDVVPESEWGSMYTTKKNDQGVEVTVPSSDAYRRARNALFQAAYGDTALLARVSEGDDGSRVVNALVGIAPKLLNVENGAANGSLGNYGLRDHILSAFNLFQDARAAGQSVAEMTANMSMFSEADADTIYLARFFEEQRNATNRMSWFLNGMCDRIMQHGAPESADSFGGFGLFEEGAEDTFGFGDVIEGGRENYAAEGKQPLPERDVWGRGSYEELADVAGLNQKERAEYYRDPDRARTSPTDSGYAGGSEPVTARETDAGTSGRDGQQGADAGSGADGGLSELAQRMLAGEVSDEDLPPDDLFSEEESKTPEEPQRDETVDMLLGEGEEKASTQPSSSEPDSNGNRTKAISDILEQYGKASVHVQGAYVQIESTPDGYEVTVTKNGQTYTNVAPNDSLAINWAYQTANRLSATETASEAQGNPAEGNSQEESENQTSDVLNAQEGRTDVNPLAEIAEETAGRSGTEQNANPNVNENVDTEANTGGANPNANTNANTNTDQENPKIPLKDLPRRKKSAKISQYFTNTLTESGRAKGLDPVTYNPTSEAESLTRAAMRLADDKIDLLDQLMKAPAWDNEMVDAAWLFENELYKQYLRTGDSRDLNAWKRIQTYKISQTAKGLQAVAKQSRPTAAAVLEASMNQLEDFKAKAKPGDQKAQQAAAKAEKDLNSAVRDLGTIENAIDDLTSSGMSETEARETLKGDLIDLSVKINQMRGVSMFGDMGNRKQQNKFRKLLGEQDAEFIQRFVACQAAGIAEDVAYKGKQDVGAHLNTFQKLAQLTGTGTWLRNLSGNASFGLIDILAADNPVTLVADQIMKAATGQRSTGFELGALDKGVLAASKRAWNRSLLEVAANIDLAENQSNTKYDMSRTRTNDPTGNMMRRALSRWEQWNGYMLNSTDKLFRGGIEQSVTNAIARANGWDVNNLTPEQRAQIRETAQQVADYRLFQNQGRAATAANNIRDMLNTAGVGGEGINHKGGFGLGTALTPYTTVPTNIGVKALEFSPANAVKGLAEMIKVASDAKKGTATMAQQNQAVTDLGRGVTGTALIAGLAVLMKNWPFFKDWENEDNKDVKQQNKAEGKQGMQFNLSMIQRYADGDKDATWRNDDRTIDISSIEPLNQLLTAASLISEGEDFGTAVLTSAKENFLQLPSVSALSNIENTIKYTDTPDDIRQTLATTAASTAGGVVGGFIPAPVRHAASVTDEFERDTSGNNQKERAVNQIISGIPGLRETLPVRTDNYGNEIRAGDTPTRIANVYGGQRHTQINQSDISREAERIRESTGEVLTPSRNAPSSEQFGDEKVKLTAEQRKAWKDDYGQDLADTVGLLMRSSIYKDADDNLKGQLWDEAAKYTRDGVKRKFAEENGLTHDSKYAYLDDVDNPVTFLTAKKAFDIAEENEQWDVVDTLIGPVGKLSEDERELMRDKNSTLMNYYDYLTPNDRGYKVKDAETVRAFKVGAKENATARGKQNTAGIDKFKSVYDGYRSGTFQDSDVDAIMSKSKTTEDEETGEVKTTWDITKGRASVYLAMRAGGSTVRDALDAALKADVDEDDTVDEKGVKIKAENEATNALKRYGNNSPEMWNAFNEIMYEWKVS